MVTAASLASMGVSALSTFVLPIIILVVARRRWGCSLWSAAVGALVFVVFALLLEGGIARAGLRCDPQPAESTDAVHDICRARGRGV